MTKLLRDKAFYFFNSVGDYTGEYASSLEEFVEKVKKIDSRSLEFHLSREDFQRWVRDILANEELAEELEKITRLNLRGESLRTNISDTVLNFIVTGKKKRRRAKEKSETETPSVVESFKEYPQPSQEHAYELEMERRLKRLLKEEKRKT